MNFFKTFFLMLFMATLIISCSSKKESDMDLLMIQKRVDAYADINIEVDLSQLSEKQQIVVSDLVQAARIADDIFWQQSSHDAIKYRENYKNQPGPVWQYIEINYGPYDRIYGNENFTVSEKKVKPEGAGFYPMDMTKAEFEKYIDDNPEQKEALENIYSIVVRDGKKLKAIPYHIAYKEKIEQMAEYLDHAAQLAENKSLQKYLSLRAKSLLSDDFYQSDLAWMDLEDNLIDVVIGPVENYEDRMFNYKAAFEAAVMIKDVTASNELDAYKKHLDNLERNLPVEDIYKKESAGSGNVLEIVNIVFFAGDFQAGIKTIAASLPNDERVISEKGAKKQLYKNIIEAKYDKILTKISEVLLEQSDHKLLSKKAFVSQVLLHELSHTLGPDYVYKSEQSVRKALKDRYSAIEECKADVLGIYHLGYLKDVFDISEEDLSKNYITYLAGLFRSIRFGYEEAHGAANLIQLNFLEKEGVISRDAQSGKYHVDVNAFHQGISKLATRLLMIEALGDYEEANLLIKNFGHIQQHTLDDINRLSEIPRDLDLHFKTNL